MNQSDYSVYQEAFEASLDAIICSNETGLITLWNPAAAKMFGYCTSEALGQPLTMLMAVADQKKHMAGFNHFLRTGKSRISGQTVEVNIQRKDGTVLPVELSLSSNKTGEGWKFTAILRDITARKQADVLLEASESRYRELYENSPLGYLSLDVDGHFIEANTTFCLMLGHERNELIGNRMEHFLTPESAKRFRNSFPEFKEKGAAYAVPFEMVAKDGHVFSVEINSRIGYDKQDSFKQTHCVVQDVSERKLVMKKLADSEDRFRNIAETASDWMWEVDANAVFTLCSPRVETLLGYRNDEIIGKTPFDLMPPDEAKRVSTIFAGIVADKKPFRNLENWNLSKDGRMVCMLTSGTPIIGNDGELLGYRGVDTDITELKQAEKEIQSERDTAQLYLNTALVMMLVINKDGTVALANRKACEVLGYSREEIIGKNWFENFLPVDQANDVASAFDMLIAGNVEPVEFHENAIMTREGSQKVIAWHNAVLRDEQGEIISILSSGEDITERKQMEKRLRFTQFAVDHSADMAFWLTSDAKFFYVNESVCKTLGYSREEMLGKSVPDINSDYPPDVWKAHWAEVKAKGPFSFESSLLSKSGESIPVEITENYMEFDGAEFNCAFVRNITERKQAEYFSGRTAEILEMVASGVAAEQIYDVICSMYEDKHPNVRTSILRRNGNQLFHCSTPSLPEAYSQAIDGMEIGACAGSCGTAAFLGKGVIVEDIATDPLWVNLKSIALPHHLRACWSEPVIGKDGEVAGTFAMYYNQPARPNDDELKDIRNASGLVSIVMDREQRQASLRTLSQAIDQAGESIMITDTKGMIEYVNPSFSRITGYTSDEVQGKNPRILKSGIQSAAYYKELWDTISNGEVWHSSVIDRRKDGSQYPATLSIAPILNDDGETTHYVGIQQDMTDHNMLEQQFYQAQKMEAIGTLVGGIAHDFNNMLAGMTGNLYLAMKKVQAQPDVVEKLAKVEAISFRAADMVQQLLTFARKDRVSMKRVPLTPFIKETIKFLHASVPENIALLQNICSESLYINGDATQLHQVLMNLINNARDAVETVEAPSITVRLSPFHTDTSFLEEHVYFTPGSYAHLSVEDNGHGIPKNMIEHIFEPFFTSKEEGKGTGLGLAMVFGAVKTHQGFVEVDSSEGKGANFHVYLPLLESRGAASELPQDNLVVEGHGEMILLVDDQQQITDTGKEVLESIGYKVLIATNGQHAIELFKANINEIDLVILDVVMPVMGGSEAARCIRQIKPQVKIIMSTGYDKNIQSDLDNEIMLGKPFSIAEMSHLIRQQLDS